MAYVEIPLPNLAVWFTVIFVTFPLIIAMMPGMRMYDATFVGSNLNDLSIWNHKGVTKIEWDLWQVCFFLANDKYGNCICTPTGVINSQYLGLTIVNSNAGGNNLQVSVEVSWLRVLLTMFVASVYIFLASLIILCLLHRADRDGSTNSPQRKNYYWKWILSFSILAIISSFIIIGAEVGVYNSINRNLQSLVAGGVTSVVVAKMEGFKVSQGFSVICMLLHIFVTFSALVGLL